MTRSTSWSSPRPWAARCLGCSRSWRSASSRTGRVHPRPRRPRSTARRLGRSTRPGSSGRPRVVEVVVRHGRVAALHGACSLSDVGQAAPASGVPHRGREPGDDVARDDALKLAIGRDRPRVAAPWELLHTTRSRRDTRRRSRRSAAWWSCSGDARPPRERPSPVCVGRGRGGRAGRRSTGSSLGRALPQRRRRRRAAGRARGRCSAWRSTPRCPAATPRSEPLPARSRRATAAWR